MLRNVGGQAMLFKSQTKRNTILALCFGVGIDVVVSYFIGTYLDTGIPPLMVAVGLPVAVYIIAWAYSLYVGLKQFAWFALFEKAPRIELVRSQLQELKFPAPDNVYDSADEYLQKVALARDTPAGTILIAGQMMGVRSKLPFVQAICSNIVMEKAIERYRQTNKSATSQIA